MIVHLIALVLPPTQDFQVCYDGIVEVDLLQCKDHCNTHSICYFKMFFFILETSHSSNVSCMLLVPRR